MNETQVKDIKSKIIRRHAKSSDCTVITDCFYIPKSKTTVATMVIIPENYGKPIISCYKRKLESKPEIKVLHGAAHKRKGEKYNQDVGEIIALIDAR